MVLGNVIPNQALEVCNLEEYCNEQGFTEIHYELFGNTRRGLGGVIQEFEWKLNDQDASGRTALWWAAWIGNEHAMRLLLDAGADAGLCSLGGRNAFHHAVDRPSPIKGLWASDLQVPELAGLLIKAGATIEATTGVMAGAQTVLHRAAIQNDAEGVAWLLRQGSKDYVPGLRHWTPLHHAIYYNSHDSLEVLLARASCAARTGKTDDHRTLLHMAAQYGDIQTYEILCKDGLSDIDIEARTKDGYTNLDVLWQFREIWFYEIFWAHLRLECSIYGKGWNAYMLYLRRTHPEVAEWLMSQGYGSEGVPGGEERYEAQEEDRDSEED